MPGKQRFWWTGPFWITREFKVSYQLGTLAREVLKKWVNGFRLKPYKGMMLVNPFKEPKEQKIWEAGEGLETGESPTGTTKY